MGALLDTPSRPFLAKIKSWHDKPPVVINIAFNYISLYLVLKTKLRNVTNIPEGLLFRGKIDNGTVQIEKKEKMADKKINAEKKHQGQILSFNDRAEEEDL